MVAKTARRAELGKPPSSTSAELADPGRKDRDVPATLDSDCSVSIPGRSDPHTMDKYRTRITRTSGMNPWRAGCGESRTSGSEGGPGRPTGGDSGTAPRSDPYTYVRTGEGWLYLASVLDLGSRRLLGWSMDDNMETTLVADALTMATDLRGVDLRGTIFHSDRGSQYLSARYRELCDRLGIRQSAGRVATCFDNSVAESFWSSLKRELVHRYRFATRAEAKAAITAWIRRYNNVRLHSTLGFVPPVEWELRYRLTQLEAA